MKKVLSLLLALSLGSAQAQQGIFPAQTVWGNNTGSSGQAKAVPFTSFTPALANPTAQIGNTVVNGTATTAMRSDAAPPLSSSVQSALTGTNAYLLTGTGVFGFSSEQYATLAQGGLGGSQAAATVGQVPIYPGTGGAAVPTTFESLSHTWTGTLNAFTSGILGTPTGPNAVQIGPNWSNASPYVPPGGAAIGNSLTVFGDNYGVTSWTRTLNGGIAIGYHYTTYANNASTLQGSWGIYGENHRITAVDGSTGYEMAVVNREATVNAINPLNVIAGPTANGMVIECGNAQAVGVYAEYSCSNALLFQKNIGSGQTNLKGFGSGIVFRGGVTGALDNTINNPPAAISLPAGTDNYAIDWWSSGTNRAWYISSNATSGNNTLVLGNTTAVWSSNIKSTGMLLSTLGWSVTAPTVASGFCSTGSPVTALSANNGTAAFDILIGAATCGSTGTLTMPAATTGWVCHATDVTTPASHNVVQTGTNGSTTAVVLTDYSRTAGTAQNFTPGDHIHVMCTGY